MVRSVSGDQLLAYILSIFLLDFYFVAIFFLLSFNAPACVLVFFSRSEVCGYLNVFMMMVVWRLGAWGRLVYLLPSHLKGFPIWNGWIFPRVQKQKVSFLVSFPRGVVERVLNFSVGTQKRSCYRKS